MTINDIMTINFRSVNNIAIQANLKISEAQKI